MQFPEGFEFIAFVIIATSLFLSAFLLKKIASFLNFFNAHILLLLLFTFFFFINNLKETLPLWVRCRYLMTICISLTLGLSYLANLYLKLTSFLNKLKIFFLTLSFILFVNGLFIAATMKEYFTKSNNVVLQTSNKIKNDIIWILLDEYASNNYLTNQLHYHNSIKDSLRAKHFFIIDSMPSISNGTLFSIASIFNFDDSIQYPNFNYAQKVVRQNKFEKKLKMLHYDFKNYDFLYFTHKSEVEASFSNIFPTSFFDQIFSNSVLVLTINYFNKNTEKISKYNSDVLNKSLNDINTNANPTFFWIHALMPHPPFINDSSGIENKYAEYFNSLSTKEMYKQYVEYLAYVNKTVLHYLNSIKDWEKKTIIISGDHGFRYGLAKDDAYTKATFAAIYSPTIDSSELKQIKYLQQIPLHLRY